MSVQPLGQTFKVDVSGGCFLTSVELYFAYKDASTPVWVEIRNVVAGAPGQRVLPYSRKVLEPSFVQTDPNEGSAATTFTFESPVFVQEGQEYSLVILTKSLDYRIWTAQMGELDVITGGVISSQPALGVLYKSSNDSAWTPAQSEDLKFKLNHAYFDNIQIGDVTLTNDIIGDPINYPDSSSDTIGQAYGRRLKPNPFLITNSSAVVKVKHPDHGMYSTSNNVEIRNATSGLSTTLNGAITNAATSLVLDPSATGGSSVTGFAASNDSSKIYLKIGNEILTGTLSNLNVTSLSRAQGSTTAAAHVDNTTVELYQINGTPLTEVNRVHNAIANINIDSYTIAITNAPTISGSSDTSEVGGISVFASENYRYETVRTVVKTLEFPLTDLTSSLASTSGTSPSGTETSFSKLATDEKNILLNVNSDLTRTNIVASNVNEELELASAKSFEIKFRMISGATNLSPVIDLDRASAILVGNVINNVDSSTDVYPTSDFAASTEPEGDQNAAIYITKKVALENPATSIRVNFAGNKSASSDIKVLFKVLRSDDSFDFDELGYEFFNTDGSTDTTVNNSLTVADFQQYSYSAGIKDDGIGASLGEFSQFAIKIVMQGTNAAQPPRIRDLRVIALAT
tara:strand:- start:183 stop:2069 length:1887 start_codon:yes stop_codon:yes gene_type:complete